MPTRPHRTRRPPRRHRATAWCWALFIAACVTLVRLKLQVDARQVGHQRDWVLDRGAFRAYAPEVGSDIRVALEPLKGMTLRQVESRLGRHRPFNSKDPPFRGYWYRMPGRAAGEWASGWTMILYFRSDRLRDVSVYSNKGAYPGPLLSWRVAEISRLALLFLGPVVWLASVLAVRSQPPARRRFAQVALASAIVTGLAWWFGPAPGTGTGRLTVPLAHVPPMLIPAAVTTMLLASVLLLGWPARSGDAALRFCHHCRYDLTGNLSGVCPECGTPTNAFLRKRHDAEVTRFAAALSGDVAPG